jgi:hypothetical protein
MLNLDDLGGNHVSREREVLQKLLQERGWVLWSMGLRDDSESDEKGAVIWSVDALSEGDRRLRHDTA